MPRPRFSLGRRRRVRRWTPDDNPWGATNEQDLLLRKIGCGICVIGIPLVAIFWIVTIILMDKS